MSQTTEAEARHSAAEEAVAPAADPAMIGVPTFIAGSVALGLVLVGFVPLTAVAASIPIILAATGIGQVISAVWAARLGQGAVAAIFGIFSGFWLSYGFLVLALTNDWLGITDKTDVTNTQGIFLISWLVVVVMLTLATLRLPLGFTVLFVLVDLALVLVLIGTLNGSAGTLQLGGIVVFLFALVGVYLFFGSASVATGGKPLPLGRPLIKS